MILGGACLERFANAIIRHKKAVIVVFVIAVAICALFSTTINVKYNMAEYLPKDAQSTQALSLLNEEFTHSLPNASVTVWNVSLMEALAFKHELQGLEHVVEVLWLDDVADLLQPLEMGSKSTIENYYKGNTAYYSVVILRGSEKEGVGEIRGLLGDRGTLSGDATEIEFVQTAAGNEVKNAMLILVPLIIIILIITTTSWIEPLLFFVSIGISVILNIGTNAFGEGVSFLTNAVTPILQMAVSLDYAIFLLHSFGKHRKECESVEIAMGLAIRESFSTVAASASTTLFGFMALLSMKFRLGADLGMSLAKGIVFSFVSVMIFLPALTLCIYKVIDKTQHREILPSFANIRKVLRKLSIPAIIIIILIIVPCFLGQSRTDFLYGYQAAYKEMTSGAAEGETTAEGEAMAEGEATASDSTVMVLLVPKGDVVREELLSNSLMEIPHVTSVLSYARTVGSGIPPEYLDDSIIGQFYSDSFARMVIYIDTPQEGDAAFATVENINAAAAEYYPEGAFSAGQSANLYDIKTVVQSDNKVTNLIAIIAIFLVLLVTFRSATLPFILLFTIEAAIWINLSIPYFTGVPINYVGYLVLNTVQLGATVDYAILLTVTYRRNRRTLEKDEAMHAALGSSFRSIIVSAATMAMAGFTLAGTSTNPLIVDIGKLLGRGTILSMVMVVVFMPAVLVGLDRAIGKTTLGG